MEATAILYILLLNIATIGVLQAQNFEWSRCSRTCGQGLRYRHCRPEENPKCQMKYEDCTLATCPDVTCIAPNDFKYKSATECCRTESQNSCGVVQVRATSRRIIDGIVSQKGQWPWQTALWMKNPKKDFCGAVLLDKEWVVTAAHCFEDNGLSAKDVFVKVGINYLGGTNPNEQSSDVDTYVKYPSYVDWNDDIALLKLKKPVQYSMYVHPICQPNNERPNQDEICYVAGWGAASHADRIARRASNKLLHAGLQILPLGACKEAYRGQSSYKGVTNKTLCVGLLKGGKDSCIGDSGGPLVCQRKHSCQWYFAGVVSFGATVCGKADNPGVYTDVQSYLPWIRDIILHPCDKSPCKNGGKCLRLGKNYRCDCDYRYKGKDCDMLNIGNWLACSRTCGGGLRVILGATCTTSNLETCRKTYSECNTQKCPTLERCPSGHQFKYKDSSACCKASADTCGNANPTRQSASISPIWPWIVAILYRDSTLQCSGTLLSKDWVLAAAHCFEYIPVADLSTILLGTSTIRIPAKPHQKASIGSVISHPNYRFPMNDIALIKLRKPVVINSHVKPICLPSMEKVKLGTTCLVAGYPYPSFSRAVPPDSTTEHFQNVLPLQVCEQAFHAASNPYAGQLDKNQHVCVGKVTGRGPTFLCASYVSGSPLMCQRCSSCGWYLAGFPILGLSCGLAPEVFTDVYHHENWIRSTTSLKREKDFSCP